MLCKSFEQPYTMLGRAAQPMLNNLVARSHCPQTPFESMILLSQQVKRGGMGGDPGKTILEKEPVLLEDDVKMPEVMPANLGISAAEEDDEQLGDYSGSGLLMAGQRRIASRNPSLSFRAPRMPEMTGLKPKPVGNRTARGAGILTNGLGLRPSGGMKLNTPNIDILPSDALRKKVMKELNRQKKRMHKSR